MSERNKIEQRLIYVKTGIPLLHGTLQQYCSSVATFQVYYKNVAKLSQYCWNVLFYMDNNINSFNAATFIINIEIST